MRCKYCLGQGFKPKYRIFAKQGFALLKYIGLNGPDF
jgi:hypothetical protein